MLNSLDPDQALLFVGPDDMQRLSTDDTSKQRVNVKGELEGANHMGLDARNPVFVRGGGGLRTTKAQTSMRIRSD